MIDFRYAYDIILELQKQLEQDHDDPELGYPDYRKIQALAATYTLQDYLSNAIATLEAYGDLEPEEEGCDFSVDTAETNFDHLGKSQDFELYSGKNPAIYQTANH